MKMKRMAEDIARSEAERVKEDIAQAEILKEIREVHVVEPNVESTDSHQGSAYLRVLNKEIAECFIHLNLHTEAYALMERAPRELDETVPLLVVWVKVCLKLSGDRQGDSEQLLGHIGMAMEGVPPAGPIHNENDQIHTALLFELISQYMRHLEISPDDFLAGAPSGISEDEMLLLPAFWWYL